MPLTGLFIAVFVGCDEEYIVREGWPTIRRDDGICILWCAIYLYSCSSGFGGRHL